MEGNWNIEDRNLSSDLCAPLPLKRAGGVLLGEWFGSKSTFQVNCLFLRITIMMIKQCPKAHLPFWWIRVVFSYHFYQFPFQSCCVVFMDVLFSPILQLEISKPVISVGPLLKEVIKGQALMQAVFHRLWRSICYDPKNMLSSNCVPVLLIPPERHHYYTAWTSQSAEANIRSSHIVVPSEYASYLTSGLLNICQRSLWRWLVW